jgi:uncharacterized protein YlxW (UPF0749 family)
MFYLLTTMIIALLFSVTAIIVFYFILRKSFKQFVQNDVSHLSDASYTLHKDIEASRSRALELKNSLQELQDSMNELKLERESLMNKQYDLLFYQENLKKWTNEVKN